MPRSILGDFQTTMFITMPPFIKFPSAAHLRQQLQPQTISRTATRNSSAPTGKIAAINIPAPSAAAQTPSSRVPPPRFPQHMRPASFPLLQYIQTGLSLVPFGGKFFGGGKGALSLCTPRIGGKVLPAPLCRGNCQTGLMDTFCFLKETLPIHISNSCYFFTIRRFIPASRPSAERSYIWKIWPS